jgi:hypothetical protein
MDLIVNNQVLFSKRVSPTKITAPTNATMIAPITPPPGQISQKPEDPAAHDPAEDAENDVNEDPVAATLHDLAGQPTRDQSNHDPHKESHSPRSPSSFRETLECTPAPANTQVLIGTWESEGPLGRASSPLQSVVFMSTGLKLSRAWMLADIANLPKGDKRLPMIIFG